MDVFELPCERQPPMPKSSGNFGTVTRGEFDLAKNGFPVDAFDAGRVTTLRSQCTEFERLAFPQHASNGKERISPSISCLSAFFQTQTPVKDAALPRRP